MADVPFPVERVTELYLGSRLIDKVIFVPPLEKLHNTDRIPPL